MSTVLRASRLRRLVATAAQLRFAQPPRRLTVTPCLPPPSFRQLCTATADETMSPSWAEHEFTAVASESLDTVSEALSDVPTAPDDYDVDLSQGVLTVHVGASLGTYVLNTQTPNRQLWLSSPVSGPFRYVWHPARREWLSTRDAHTLSEKLSSELSHLLNTSIDIRFS